MIISGKETKFAQGGRFAVTEGGIVYKSTKKGYVLARQWKACRAKRYSVTSATINKKQTHFYVHRLVAEAFIPNPNNHPQINHIDGNPSNNHFSNLEWCTASHNVQHAVRTGLIKLVSKHGIMCTDCSKKRREVSPLGICADCLRWYWLTEGYETERELKLSKMFGDVKTGLLSDREQVMLDMRMNGKTLQEIASEFGVTRQRAEQILKRASQKTELRYAVHKPGYVPKKKMAYVPKPTAERAEHLESVYENLVTEIFKEHRSLRDFCGKHQFDYHSTLRRINGGLAFSLPQALQIAKILNNPDIERLFEISKGGTT